MLITTALKEWSVAVEALAAGETILLLRKGGIREKQGRFSTEAENVMLFPTFEHQKPHLLKPSYRGNVAPVESGWHPNKISIKAWANITNIFLTQDITHVNALSDFHIWQPELAVERLKWKPSQPLYVLALRVYRLAEPIDLDWQDSYGGCRSWISLTAGVHTENSEVAIADATYNAQITKISTILAS